MLISPRRGFAEDTDGIGMSMSGNQDGAAIVESTDEGVLDMGWTRSGWAGSKVSQSTVTPERPGARNDDSDRLALWLAPLTARVSADSEVDAWVVDEAGRGWSSAAIAAIILPQIDRRRGASLLNARWHDAGRWSYEPTARAASSLASHRSTADG